jgi:hypothetical protein
MKKRLIKIAREYQPDYQYYVEKQVEVMAVCPYVTVIFEPLYGISQRFRDGPRYSRVLMWPWRG